MTLRKCASIAGIVFVALLAAGSSGCTGGGGTGTGTTGSGGASNGGGSITVSAVPDTATVEEGTTAGFTAMVTGDGANEGVTWAVSCSAATCGSVSPSSTASGATTTYTPPAPPASDLSVTLKATSVVDATKSAIVAVSVPAIRVSVAPTSANVQAGTKAQFTVTVTNDGANKGVIWTVSCTAAPCGSVSLPTTASGAATTYSAPASPPPSPLTVTLTATSVSDGTKTASTTVTVSMVTVSVSPSTAMLKVGASAQFSATVANDVASRGVTWTLSCSSPSCGSVSPAATASGAITTYTAPSTQIAGNLTVTLTATSVTDPAASTSVTITVTGITISTAPPSATVPTGGTQPFTATVDNDPNNGGVTWQVVAKLWCDGISSGRGCNPPGEAAYIFVPCGGCGTASPASTPSGAPTTYTAPVHLTPPSQNGYFFCSSCSGSLFIVATSVTKTSVSASASLTVAPISVSVSPTQAKVALNATQQFTATVTNDGTNSGVTWSLTENGVGCSPGCGTIVPASTASGAAATYSAPMTAPVTPLVTVAATSVEDTAKVARPTVMLTTPSGAAACSAGSGSEFLLKGQYAFLLQGDLAFFGEGSVVGSFTADGTGKVTGGEEDFIGIEGVSIDTTASLYAVGPDHRGCLVLTGLDNASTPPVTSYQSFSFSLDALNSGSVATDGRIVELNYSLRVGTGESERQAGAAGILRLQDATSFTANQFKGNYIVGFTGSDFRNLQNGSRRVAMAGTIAADGASAISSGTFDINDLGTITTDLSSTPEGTFTCCDANGHGALNLQISNAPIIGFYMINSGDAILISNNNNVDVFQGVGEAIGVPSTATFNQASLNGVSVLRGTAQSATGAVVDIATVSADGKGVMTVNDNVNDAGTFNSSSTPFNYTVASNGRVTLTGGNTPPVLYLYGPNQGFLVGADPDVTLGILEPQTAGPFGDASFSGSYVFGTENPSVSTVVTESGVLTADGKGSASGTSVQWSPTAVPADQSFNFTYSFPANGVGNVGSGTTAILISGNKLAFINNISTNPTITVVEK